jgi:hypothetical protein
MTKRIIKISSKIFSSWYHRLASENRSITISGDNSERLCLEVCESARGIIGEIPSRQAHLSISVKEWRELVKQVNSSINIYD